MNPVKYSISEEQQTFFRELTLDTVSRNEHFKGMMHCDPLVMIFDNLLKYAQNHKAKYEANLAEDYFTGPILLDMLQNARLLISTDGEFDTGTLEKMYWEIGKQAGFSEEQLEG